MADSSNIQTHAELYNKIVMDHPRGAEHWVALKRDAHFGDHFMNGRFNDAYMRYMEVRENKDWIGHWL